MILRLQILTPYKPPITLISSTTITTFHRCLKFRRNILYLQSLKVNTTKAIQKYPNIHAVPLSNIESITQCLLSMGLELSDIGRILDMHPELLLSDPYADIYPIFDFLLNTVELPFPEIRKSIVRCPRLLVSNPEARLKPAFEYLTKLGFSGRNKLTARTSLLLVSKVDDTLKPKIEYLVKLGLEYNDVRNMVVRSPGLLTFSVNNNYKPKVAYLLEEMNGNLDEIKRFPQYFSFSLERKIKPRHMHLMERGLLMSLPEMLKTSDGEFNAMLIEKQLQMTEGKQL